MLNQTQGNQIDLGFLSIDERCKRLNAFAVEMLASRDLSDICLLDIITLWISVCLGSRLTLIINRDVEACTPALTLFNRVDLVIELYYLY